MDGFKKFLLRGNVVDLAVAVIIGAAFKSIIDAFTAGIINPVLGEIVGKPNFDEALIFGPIHIGLVLTAVANFVIVAAVIYFLFVQPMNAVQARMKKDEIAAPPEPSDEVKLLTEIRDALKK
jgi:large conductance mechanosensitive channel